jgi:hypothetical protein
MIACDDEGELYFAVTENSGGGYWSSAPVGYADIAAALAEDPSNITSVCLFKLTKGRSVNSAGFLLAALKSEGVVKPLKGLRRKHELGDLEGFRERINKLIAGDAKPKTTRKKAAVKKKATPRKRSTR